MDAVPLLPAVRTPEDFFAARGTPRTWLPAMRVICRRHGLDPQGLYAEPSGTNVVFGVGQEAWIKLVVPLWTADFHRERAALEAVRSDPRLPAPRLIATGSIEGWPYLVLGTVKGQSAVLVWDGLARAEQADLAEQIGRLAARLHAVDAGEGMAPLRHDWDAFLAKQIEGCAARHATFGATAAWQRDIVRFLDEVPSWDTAEQGLVLLHADMTDEHVMVALEDGRWTVTGLVDFADAMLGAPLYELAAPGAFLTARRPWAQRAMLRGYGLPEERLDANLARRLTGYVLVHRFSRLDDLLRLCPPPRPASLAELHAALWTF